MEKDLTIVSSKTAKDLKDFGFDIICPNCYGVAIIVETKKLINWQYGFGFKN